MSTIEHNPMRHAPTRDTTTLDRTARRVRRTLVAIASLRAITALCLLTACAIVLDAAMVLPEEIRAVLLIGTVLLGTYTLTRWVRPALRVRPSVIDMALLTAEAGSAPGLAARVDLTDTQADSPLSRRLLDAIRHQAPPPQPRPIWNKAARRELACYALVLAALGAAAFVAPSHARTGLERLVLPFGDARWPTRHAIALDELGEHHPTDRALVARMRVRSEADDPGVRARWRVVGRRGDLVLGWTTMVPSEQRRDEQDRRVYELVVPVQTLTRTTLPRDASLEIEAWTIDDAPPRRRVRLVHPPSLVRVDATVTPPAYVLDGELPETLIQGQRSLRGNAITLGPILEGSGVEMRWVFDKPVTPSSGAGPGGTPESVRANVDATSDTFVRLAVTDELGYSPRAAPEAFLRVVRDESPSARLLSPQRDTSVGPGAVLPLAAALGDDIALRSAAIDMRVSGSDAPEEWTPLHAVDLPSATRSTQLEHTLTVADGVEGVGVTIELRVVGTDAAGRAGRSGIRTIRIVDETTLTGAFRERLAAMGTSIRAIDERQASLSERLTAGDPASAADQGTISSLIDAQVRETDEMLRAIELNRLSDAELGDLASSLRDALESAARGSERARESFDAADTDTTQDRMSRVRDELARAAALVDRGEDTWLARRRIESLRGELERLRDDTGAFERAHAGERPEELGNEDRAALEDLAARQDAAAQNARELLDELSAQGNDGSSEQAAADAIREAAREGQRRGIDETLRRGAEDLEQNRTASAGASQDDALETIDEMLERLESAAQRRDAQLRRALASLIQTIESLVASLETQVAALDRGEPDAALAQSMISIRGATLAARDAAVAQVPDSTLISSSLSRASQLQERAVVALREDPGDRAAARRAELDALSRLNAALAEAQRLDEQAAGREARRARAELRGRYAELLTTHREAESMVEPLAGRPLTRRERADAREALSIESGVKESLGAILDETDALADAAVLELTHDTLDTLLTRVIKGLSGRDVDERTAAAQSRVTALIVSIVDALAPGSPGDDQFQDGGGGGGSGGGAGGGQEEQLVPPIAELKMLRSLQQMATTQTRLIGESDASDNAALAEIGELQRRISERARELVEQMNQDPPTPEEVNIDPGPVPEGGREETP